MHDIHNDLNVTTAITAAALTDDKVGVEIDLQGYEGCEFVVAVGAAAVTTMTGKSISFKVTECATTGGSFTAVAEADLLGAVSGTTTGQIGSVLTYKANTNAVVKGGYRGNKRYVKLTADFEAAHGTATPIGAMCIRGAAVHKPVS